MPHRVFPLLVVSLFAVLLVIAGCGGGGSTKRAALAPLTDISGNAVATDDDGAPLFDLQDAMDPTKPSTATVIAQLTNLTPGQRVEAMLFKDDAPLYEHPIQLTAGTDGTVPLAMFYDIGVNPLDGSVDPNAAGSYLLQVTSNGKVLISQAFTVGVDTKASRSRAITPTIDIMRDAHYHFAGGSIRDGSSVYVWGRNMTSGDKYALYVVPDQITWSAGDALNDVTGAVEVATVVNGSIALTDNPAARVWDAATPTGEVRNFDVIAKKLPAGVSTPPDNPTFADGDIANATLIPGFTVQHDAGIGGERAFRVACTEKGVFKSVFNKGENVSVWVNPPGRITETFWKMVGKFIVIHKAAWVNGDVLIDASGRPEWDIVRLACSNEFCHTLWYSAKAGIYDVIVDVDGDGNYTLGVDLVDQGPDGTGGVKVIAPENAVMTVGADKSVVTKNEPVTLTAQVQKTDDEGAPTPVAGVTVTFTILNGSGTLSSATATTDANGNAVVQVTPTARGAELQIDAAAQVVLTSKTVKVNGQCYIATRAAGDLGITIR